MAKKKSEQTSRGPLFGTSLRGYSRDEVDTHFAHVEREAEHLRAQLRASLQDSEAAQLAVSSAEQRLQEVETKLEATESALNLMVAELERSKAEVAALTADRDAAVSRTENLDFEENAARAVLKAAHKTAEDMREQGRTEAAARVVAAEEHAQTVEAAARRRVQALEAEELELRARYESFLTSARTLASSFVREVDESRDKQ